MTTHTDTSGRDVSSSTRRRRRPTGCVVAIACMALVLSACGGGEDDGANADGSVTITVASWDAAEETARQPWLDLVSQFEEEHPDIQVETEVIAFSDIEQQILQRVQSQNAPDVTQLAGNYTFNLEAAGALTPLDDLAGQEYLDEIVPEVREVVTVDGELIAAPWAVQPVGFWYNKSLMSQAGLDPESPPATMDELLDQMATIQQELPDVIPLGLDSTNRVFGLDVNWPLMTTFGADPVADGADTPQMAEYLQFMRTLAEEGYTEVNQRIGYFRPIAAEGNVVFVWDQPILQSVVQGTSGVDDATFYDEWGVTTLPVADSGGPASVAQDHSFGILSSSQQKEAAWTFVEWMTRSEAAMAHVVENKGAIPPIEDPGGEAGQLVEDSPLLQVWSEEVVPTTVRPPWGPDYSELSSPIMVGVQQMMTSDRPVDDVVAEMQGQLDSQSG